MKATFLSRGKAGPCEPQWAGTPCKNTCLVVSAGWSGETHVSPCVGNLNLCGGPWSGRPLLWWTSFFRWEQSGNVSQGSGARRGTAGHSQACPPDITSQWSFTARLLKGSPSSPSIKSAQTALASHEGIKFHFQPVFPGRRAETIIFIVTFKKRPPKDNLGRSDTCTLAWTTSPTRVLLYTVV